MSWQELKQKGNAYFARKDYEGALTFYTKALEQSPEHTVYSNRSIALCKLGRYRDALQDAVECIELEPSFARGYLRKCTALNELKRHKEAMESAQEGYKLRGSDTISRNCVDQWLVAVQAMLKEKVERTQKKIQFIFPEEVLVISDEYLALLLDVFLARVNSAVGVPVESMAACLFKILQELDRVLQLFSHSPNPFGDEWVMALCDASKLNPSFSKVPPKAVAAVLSKSEQLAAWLHAEVDHILYPILCPIMSLAIMAVCARIFSLNFASMDQHVVEVTCRACLPFFEKSLLSAPTYVDQHIGVYKELLEAMAKFRHRFSKDEIQSIKESLQKLHSLLEQTPQRNSNVFEKALGSIRLVNYRLGQNPGFDYLPYASRPIEEVLSFVEAKEKVLISAINDVLQGFPLSESVYNDCRSLLICTGTLIKAGRPERAAEIFKLGEQVFSMILQTQILSESFSLDTAPDVFFIMQSIALTCAKSFFGVNNKLLADAIIKWKCLFSQLRALLMQFGMGAKYLATFKAIQDMQMGREMSSSDIEAQLIQLAGEHQREVHQVMCDKGMHLLVPLLNDTHEYIQRLLKPGQIVLDFCTAHDQDSISRNVIADKESHGLLLVLQADESPVIQSIDFAKAAEYTHKWIEKAPKYSEDEALKLTTEICNLLIPEEIQAIISSSCVQQVLICPDPSFTLVPFELLPLPGTQLLGEKCTLVYLSAARELLRKPTLNAAQLVFSLTEMSVENAQTAENLESFHDTQPLTPTQAAETETPVRPSTKQCLIISDPNYNLEQTAEGVDAGILQKLIASMSSLFLKPLDETTFACPLPRTRDEAHQIQYILSVAENPLETHCILGDEATVSSVLQVQSPFVLHFSTHAFSKSSNLGVSGTFWDDTKCGLILAGANTYHRGDLAKVIPAAGTGVLTALAVMGMNLYETRLVFLSVCTSARGSVAPNESVNSLAHAFRAAGAQTVVATMWTVLDDEARIFAVHFYQKACKTGIRPSQALASAKKKMQESGYQWFYWSSFICIGEDVPLFQEM